MGQEYINIGGIQFRPQSFADMEKKSFVTYYSGKLKDVDVNIAWDIIQDHLKPIRQEQKLVDQNKFNKKANSKVVRK